MKHLFQVHSSTTYHSALAVCRYKALSLSECFFLPIRGFVCPDLPEEATIVELSARSGIVGLSLRTLRKNLYTLQKSDGEIDDLLKGEKFEFYVPQTWHDSSHLLISHRLCAGFSYLEEGWTSYYKFGGIERAYPTKQRTLWAHTLRLLFFRGRLPSKLSFFHQGYRFAYGLTDMSFPDWKNRVVLGLPESLITLTESSPETPPVLVFDALVELGKASIESVVYAITKLLDRLVEANTECLRYKFHGAQTYEASKSELEELFVLYKNHIQIEQLPAETVLETMVSNENFIMYTFNSAAGLYAALAGRKVISINDFVLEVDSAYRFEMKSLPDVFPSLIGNITEDTTEYVAVTAS